MKLIKNNLTKFLKQLDKILKKLDNFWKKLEVVKELLKNF